MTTEELVERILDDYKKEWDSDPSNSDIIEAFRNGVLFAYNYLLVTLRNNDSWIYEEEDNLELCYHDKKEIEKMKQAQSRSKNI